MYIDQIGQAICNLCVTLLEVHSKHAIRSQSSRSLRHAVEIHRPGLKSIYLLSWIVNRAESALKRATSVLFPIYPQPVFSCKWKHLLTWQMPVVYHMVSKKSHPCFSTSRLGFAPSEPSELGAYSSFQSTDSHKTFIDRAVVLYCGVHWISLDC